MATTIDELGQVVEDTTGDATGDTGSTFNDMYGAGQGTAATTTATTTTYNPDGSVTYTDPDGQTYTVLPNGNYTGGSGNSAWTYNASTGQSSYNNAAGASALKTFIDGLAKKVGLSSGSQLATVAGGLYGLYRSQNPTQEPPKGYQGGIPSYTAVQQQVANTYDPNRRPGSSGQRYFTDVQYAKAPDVEAAKTAAATQAAQLEAANAANPARQSVGLESIPRETTNPVVAPAATPVASQDQTQPLAAGGIAGLSHGRYLGGPTDGMADKIPARIGGDQEARLSHGEFVIPADVVSHLGNGNSDAGAQRLYSMMDRIRKARTGTTRQGKQINPDKYTPA